MKALAYGMTCLVVLAGTLMLQADPGGVLTFTIKADGSDTYLVQELNLTGGVPRVVMQQDFYPYGGIDAPPWMGDPFVVYDSGSGGTHPLIRLVGHYGSSGTVVDYTDVTRPADPGFSADGELVVFVYEDAGPNNEDELWTVTPGGMNLTQIYAPTPGQDLDFGRPRFAPDRQKIIFQHYNNATGDGDIQMIAVTGGVPSKVTNLPDNSEHPAISPDEQHRACVTQVGGTMTLFIARGSSPAQQVNLGGQYALYPAFSPDSRYIAVVSDNGINIIELATNTIVRHLPVPYDIPFGLCWHLDAIGSDGQVMKMKISEKALSIKTGGFVSPEAPVFGMVQVGSLLFPLDVAAAWQNKKDKKFMYNDKVLKRKAKMVVKSEKGMFSAKKLSLVENADYVPGTNARVIINMGRVTMMEMVPLDEKGKYKRPK